VARARSFEHHPDPGNRAAVSKEVSTLARRTSYRADSANSATSNSVWKHETTDRAADHERQPGGNLRSRHGASGNLRSFSHSDFEISYPTTGRYWRPELVRNDRAAEWSFEPSVAYGIMINTFSRKIPAATLTRPHELLASLRR
jgi:hypothetical protein